MTGRSSAILRVQARQILDSRGRPTIEADVTLENGIVGRACAPSGASTGRHEAWELREGDPNVYEGRGVLNAVANVNDRINQEAIGRDVRDQRALDDAMIALDGSEQLASLGANAILATSLAACRAAALYENTPLYAHISGLIGQRPMSLPMPMTNILSGGAHAGRGMDIQDFLVVPVGATSYGEALDMISRVRSAGARLMGEMNLSILLADEGGLSPGFSSAEAALDLMMRAFDAAGLRPGVDVAIALDVAASELYKDGNYILAAAGGKLTSAEMVDYIVGLVRSYPIISVEDALEQDDWEPWAALTKSLADIQIVGDDLFVTNSARINDGFRAEWPTRC